MIDARPWIALLERQTDALVVVYERHVSLVVDGEVVRREARGACLAADVIRLGVGWSREVVEHHLAMQLREVA